MFPAPRRYERDPIASASQPAAATVVRARHPFSEMSREVVRQVAGENRLSCRIDVVLHAEELHLDGPWLDIEQHIAGTPVPVLGTSNATGVHVSDIADDAGAVCACARRTQRHPAALSTDYLSSRETVAPVASDVHGVECVIAVQQRDRGPRRVTAERSNVDPKWKRAEQPHRGVRDVLLGPGKRQVRLFLLDRIFVPTAAVLVTPRDRRVVVTGDASGPLRPGSRATTSFGHGA